MSDTITADTKPGQYSPKKRSLVDPATPVLDEERFVIEDEHARGGIGRVLQTQDRFLGRTIAIKETLGDKPVARARFRREALITARLPHLLIGDEEGRVVVRALDAGTPQTLTGHTASIRSTAYSPGGTYLATADERGVVRVRVAKSGDSAVLRGHQRSVFASLFSPTSTPWSPSTSTAGWWCGTYALRRSRPRLPGG